MAKAPLLTSFCPTCSRRMSVVVMGRCRLARNCSVLRQARTSHSVFRHSACSACSAHRAAVTLKQGDRRAAAVARDHCTVLLPSVRGQKASLPWGEELSNPA